MTMIDITGPIVNQMWRYPDPYPPVRVTSLPAIPWVEGPCFSEAISFSVQAGTYMETWAHWDRAAPAIDGLSPDHFVLDAVVLQVPTAAQQAVRLEDVEEALAKSGGDVPRGGAILLASGWDSHWADPEYVSDGPYMTPECMRFLTRQSPRIIGMDTARFVARTSDYATTASFFRAFLRGTGNALLVAPVNLTRIPSVLVRLYAFPLRIPGAVAAPCRAVVEVPD